MSSAAEKHAKANTLSCVVGLCIGKITTIELRNESHITGRVVEVIITFDHYTSFGNIIEVNHVVGEYIVNQIFFFGRLMDL